MKKITTKEMDKILAFFTFAILLSFESCRKSSNNSVMPNNPVSRISGIWAMRGHHDYLAHGVSDSINTNISVWIADSSTVVVYSQAAIYSGYTAYKLSHPSDSIYVFGGYSYNVNKDSLQYYLFYRESGNYQIVSMQSVSHMPFANSSVSANTAKMEGTKQWHGSHRTVDIPPWYTGLPNVDTTYYNPMKMQISALSDSLIMVRMFYWFLPGPTASDSVAEYLFLEKSYADPSIMTFTSHENPDETVTMTYYFATNSMFYFDSSGGTLPSVYKYYTP